MTPTVPVAFAPAQVSHANALDMSCAEEDRLEHGCATEPVDAGLTRGRR